MVLVAVVANVSCGHSPDDQAELGCNRYIHLSIGACCLVDLAPEVGRCPRRTKPWLLNCDPWKDLGYAGGIKFPHLVLLWCFPRGAAAAGMRTVVLGFPVKLHLCLGPRNAGENINGAVLLGTSVLRLRNESRHCPDELPHISWNICAACRGWVLFVWAFKKKKKKSHREAEVFARDFTGAEIFRQTFLLRQHSRTSSLSSSVLAQSAGTLR